MDVFTMVTVIKICTAYLWVYHWTWILLSHSFTHSIKVVWKVFLSDWTVIALTCCGSLYPVFSINYHHLFSFDMQRTVRNWIINSWSNCVRSQPFFIKITSLVENC